MKALQLCLVVLLMAAPAWTQNEPTSSAGVGQDWDAIISSTTNFWGFLMGWGDYDLLRAAIATEETTSGTALAADGLTTEPNEQALASDAPVDSVSSTGSATVTEVPQETTTGTATPSTQQSTGSGLATELPIEEPVDSTGNALVAEVTPETNESIGNAVANQEQSLESTGTAVVTETTTTTPTVVHTTSDAQVSEIPVESISGSGTALASEKPPSTIETTIPALVSEVPSWDSIQSTGVAEALPEQNIQSSGTALASEIPVTTTTTTGIPTYAEEVPAFQEQSGNALASVPEMSQQTSSTALFAENPTTPIPQTSTEIEIYEDDDAELEAMDLGETIYSWLTIILPNTAYITVSIFGTWIQMFANSVQRSIISPVFSALGSFFDIPLGGDGFDVGQIIKDFAGMIAMPFQEMGGMALEGISMGTDFVQPILNCLGSTIKGAQELLLGVFQIFPACAANLSSNVIQIIVDTMQVIEGLSSVFTVVMETLNSCMANPLMCILTNTMTAYWGISKATIEVSQNAMILVDLMPATGDAAAQCLSQASAHLMQQMPEITDLFMCRG